MKVWDVEVGGGLITQIFETDDGNLWQLSDVGLGWSKFAKPESHWKVDEKSKNIFQQISTLADLSANRGITSFNLQKAQFSG